MPDRAITTQCENPRGRGYGIGSPNPQYIRRGPGTVGSIARGQPRRAMLPVGPKSSQPRSGLIRAIAALGMCPVPAVHTGRRLIASHET